MGEGSNNIRVALSDNEEDTDDEGEEEGEEEEAPVERDKVCMPKEPRKPCKRAL